MRRLLLFAFLLNCVLAHSEPPSPKIVDILSSDGTKLRATYYPAQQPGPAVLLLHMCNTTRASWEPVARLLSSEGISALTIDNRGFGESGGPRFEGASPEAQQEITKNWPADFDAAFQYLVSQSGVDPTRIGVGGGSCGVRNSVGVAERHPSVKALVLLAGGMDLKGLNFLIENPQIPLFTAAASDDEYIHAAPELMRWYSEVTANPRNQFVGFQDGRHGTEIFGSHPELEQKIVAFLKENLAKAAAHADSSLTSRATQAAEFWKLATRPGNAQRAEAMFQEVRKHSPNTVLFPEYMMNLLGYDRLQNGDRNEALILLKLNSEAYPDSANTWDSLSDAYIANGKPDLALAAEETCLRVLPADPAPNKEFKAGLRKQAEEKIARLKFGKK